MGDLCGIESIKELERVWAFPWLAFNTCHLIRKMLFRVIKLMLITLILSNFLINFANYPRRSIESWIERNTVRTAGVGSSINLEMFCYRHCMVHADTAYRVIPNRTIHLFLKRPILLDQSSNWLRIGSNVASAISHAAQVILI